MKTCPHCQSDSDDHFEVCWNCNYSFTEGKIIETDDVSGEQKPKAIDCLRCKVPLVYSGNYKFHEGTRMGLLGNIFEVFVNRESFDIYLCPECRKLEFYAP
jgi:Zn finger protein HypA/HybF involved in hydrogenase expression